MNTPEAWSSIVRVVALAIPATLALPALASRRGPSPARATVVSSLALALACLTTVGAALTRGSPLHEGVLLSGAVRVDAVTCVMLLLVCSLGAVVVRYSRTLLEGEPGLARYFRWLLLTLGSVTALVVANNLLAIALAWTATSLALHQLLTFYSDRTAALIAAHKKFLVSRAADASLLACLALVHANVGSLDLDRIAVWADSHRELTPSMHFAAVLVVVAVALRSAQLPFHGWLTQVMEAPTPVSALLHAGVVNIGGFVLIRLAPWMARATFAQSLLVATGLVSAVIAALVMTTRVSVKVALAWSTCAQTGFMLVQCGLGAWHLALLHLVAHSLYKAHAFLDAGTAVDEWRLQSLTIRPPAPSWPRLAVATLVSLGSAIACIAVIQHRFAIVSARDPSVAVLAVLVSLSMVPLLARQRTSGLVSTIVVAVRAIGVVSLYVGWHAATAHLVPVYAEASNLLAWVLVGVAFTALFVVRSTLAMHPRGRLARALHPSLFAGLYLDERFTRFTFRVWPPRLHAHDEARALHVRKPLEVRP